MKQKSKKSKVLFVCVHNSARSQIAEALLNFYAGELFEVESAGLEPGELNQLAVETMREVGLDISRKKTQSVFELFKKGKFYHYVITVCDEEAAQKCPVFPKTLKVLSWSFPDPALFNGSHDEKLKQMRLLRNRIQLQVKQFIEECQSR